MGQDPSQNIGTEIRISFLISVTERIYSRFSVKRHNNMHPLGRACSYNLLLVTNPSILKCLYGINAFACFRFITCLCPHPSVLQGTNCIRTLPLLNWLVLFPPSSTFLPLPCPSVFVVLDLLPIGKESLIEKVSFEKVLHNHLLNPGHSDPWLFFPKSLRNVLAFLLLECLELCLRRTTFLSVGEQFSNSHFRLISGPEFMSKKVLFEECIIFTIFLLTCLCLLTKLAATIIEISAIRSFPLGEKNFLSLTLSR